MAGKFFKLRRHDVVLVVVVGRVFLVVLVFVVIVLVCIDVFVVFVVGVFFVVLFFIFIVIVAVAVQDMICKGKQILLEEYVRRGKKLYKTHLLVLVLC